MRISGVIFSILFSVVMNGQQKELSLSELAQEKVFLHINTKSFFTGEQLYYKFYARSAASKRASGISKIGYIELVNQGGQSVFKHKIRLEQGAGDGEFFIDTDVPTGTYRIYAYTQWMLNIGVASFYKEWISITNPYQPLGKQFIDLSLDTIKVKESDWADDIKNQDKASGQKEINFSNGNPKAREKVFVSGNIAEGTLLSGQYSVSITKADGFGNSLPLTAIDFSKNPFERNRKSAVADDNLMYLPELRGEILSGKIINKETKAPASREKLALSLPGQDYLFKLTTSNENGKFHFNINDSYSNTSAVVQHLSSNWADYEIVFDEIKVKYDSEQGNPLLFHPSASEQILNRSIHNQIENAYDAVKRDSISPATHVTPFYRKLERVYLLDDYKRFSTVKETMVEIVDQVTIKRLRNGVNTFIIKDKAGYVNPDILPMVFVDGLYLRDHEDFMDYNSKKIASIGYNRDRFFVGSQIYHGVLDIKTIEGNFADTFFKDHVKQIDLFEPLPSKRLYSPSYANTGAKEDLKRVPDFRRQLLWLPDYNPKDAAPISFYTSDLKGDFILSIEGFQDNGEPVSITKLLQVN